MNKEKFENVLRHSWTMILDKRSTQNEEQSTNNSTLGPVTGAKLAKSIKGDLEEFKSDVKKIEKIIFNWYFIIGIVCVFVIWQYLK